MYSNSQAQTLKIGLDLFFTKSFKYLNNGSEPALSEIEFGKEGAQSQ
jgi:hypothetical protein